jgi:hypothetical protein
VAFVGSIFALAGRFAGRLLNSTLGWATVLLFGKVSGRNQTILLVIAFGSLVWVLTLVGILFPDVGTFLLTFVPLPDFVDEDVVRLVMLGLALLVPLLIGVAAIAITETSRRPRGSRLLAGLLRGYPFTFALAVTIGVLAIASLSRKVRSLARRWADSHVPVVVKPGGYDQVLLDVEGVLDGAGLSIAPKPAPRILSLPPRLLEAVAGNALGGLVPDRLMLLSGRDLEVLVYPSDLAISGTAEAMARARAAIASQLTRSPVYLTSSAEAQRIEEEVRSAAAGNGAARGIDRTRRIESIRALDGRLARLVAPFDEWETVYRERLQVERDLLDDDRWSNRGFSPTAPAPSTRPSVVEWLIGGAGLVLLALDVLLLLERRLTRR